MNEFIYCYVCMLYWRTDMTTDDIAAFLKGNGITEYTHTGMSKNYTYTDLKQAVLRIIESEKMSHLKAKEFKLRKYENKKSATIFRTFG